MISAGVCAESAGVSDIVWSLLNTVCAYTKSLSALSNQNPHSIQRKHAYTDYNKVLSVTGNDYNRNENGNDNSVTMNANARNNSVGQTHSNLECVKTRKKQWFMREICVKTKPSGVGMRGYAQMVCAGRYTFTQLKCVETALHTSTKTAHNIDGTHYVFDLHSERRSSKRLLIRWSRVRISPDPPLSYIAQTYTCVLRQQFSTMRHSAHIYSTLFSLVL